MSGGVDSSVAAARLVREGYDVVGVFMRLGTINEPEEMHADTCPTPVNGDSPKPDKPHRGCCSVGDAADARVVAAELGIPLYICNFRKDFARIIDHFADEYASGRTPNPCVRCNDWLKFGKLHDYAKRIGASAVASGHYARLERRGATEGGAALLRGRDGSKDQSYVLFGSPRGRLAEMMLPIGEFERKAEVRDEAERLGLPVFDKPDSQEICFVPDDDYASVVERRRPELAANGAGGAILDAAGNRVGTHDGHHRDTIGQRRGVGVAFGHPIYVIEKDAAANTITIGERSQLRTTSLLARDANWLVDAAPFEDGREVLAQVRYNARAVPARARVVNADGAFEVVFDEPHEAVAPGQAAVLYDPAEPARVLGGGWIASTTR